MISQLLSAIAVPETLVTFVPTPPVLGVSAAILGLTLVLLRRRSEHHNREVIAGELSLFPMLTPMPPPATQGRDNSYMSSNTKAKQTFSPRGTLQLVDQDYEKDPHAFLRKLLAGETLALQELVQRANSLQLLIDSDSSQQSSVCIELLRMAQSILKTASQRCATAELLADDALESSIQAAFSLLRAPLQLETDIESGQLWQIDPNKDWAQSARDLLDDVEQELRIVAVG